MRDISPRLDLTVTPEGREESQSATIHVSETPMNLGIRERSTVVIEKPPGAGWALFVDDQPLALNDGGSWSWQPQFYAGVVSVELERDGHPVGQYRLDVSPDPKKISLDWYQEMLQLFREAAPDWVTGTEPGSRAWGTEGFHEDPWVQFRRLRRHVPALLQSLGEVSRHPIRSRKTTRSVVPMRKVRRLDARTIRAAAANGTLGYLNSDSVHPGEVARGGESEPLYEVPSYEEHLDGPANRCLAFQLRSLIHRTRTLGNALGEWVQEHAEPGAREGLAERWERRRGQLTAMESRLLAALKHEPFCSVTRPEITSAGLTSISAHPDYSRAYRAGWQATRSGIEGIDAAELMWLCPTWELYERWCYIAVRGILEHLGVTKIEEWRTVTGACFTGASNGGNRVLLYFQKKFSGGGLRSRGAGFESISRERVPDLVITVEGNRRQRFAVLDSKYRTSRGNILDAMASAHIYHDSLRWRGRSPDVSVLLVPTTENASWLEDPGFIRREGVGAVALCPGAHETAIRDVLVELIGS